MEGWGAAATVTAKAAQNFKLSTKNIVGIVTMSYVSEPVMVIEPPNRDQDVQLSEAAKKLLREEGPDAFHAKYGNLFIAGETRGAYAAVPTAV